MSALEDPKLRPSEPRERLLRVASELFYRDGINSVGVDRILGEAGVTRATLYRHFAGKEGLVESYLDREDQTIRGYFSAAEEHATSPQHYLEMVVGGIAEDALRYHTRGCPFINASAEYPDPNSGVRQRVTAHRNWFRQALEAALANAGRPDPAERARTLVLLRDAALIGGYLDGPASVTSTFTKAAREVAGLD
ncbi:TetR/AcrR family transcriptional regulator [Lysinimonas soli]|uniref:TetR/AcrR family transcriptional regulator n=1 Tax=Lysinimonas soli TaxID=1074233 RepID=A0ABW0NVU2_9MICO